MKTADLAETFRILRKHSRQIGPASVTEISIPQSDRPFRVLFSCLISLRTKDEVTTAASERLFHLAKDPESLLRVPVEQIEKAIYPCAFFRNKAKNFHEISRDLIDRFGGKVPEKIDDLLTLKGVGRKTANLVRTLGHGKPGICVDIHVHRITNRWGLVSTQSPDQTEQRLREILPRRYWIPINDLLVTYGQTLCRPLSPYCSRCGLTDLCERVGVERFR